MYFWIMKVCERIAGLFNPDGAIKGEESTLDGAYAVAETSAAGCGSCASYIVDMEESGYRLAYGLGNVGDSACSTVISPVEDCC